MSELAEGALAPDFTLEGQEGPIRLSDFAGKTLVLYFYPKDDTSGCTREAQAFSDLEAEFAKAGAQVLGVSKDSLASHKKFAAKYDLTFPLASDPDNAAATAYGVWVEKSMYGKTYMGIERSTFLVGKDGKVAKAWRGVKVPGHVEAVAEAAKAL